MWKPIETEQELPAPGAYETISLDFKSKPTTDRFEAAKDIAAFANAEGGTLLIGAAGGDLLVRYEPLAVADARSTIHLFDEAVRDRCSPAPLFGFQEIRKDGGVVIAVNVWPFPGQIVGVRLRKDEVRCGTSGSQQEGMLVFPLRVGTHTRTITPEQIPMFVDPHARRVAMCLNDAAGKRVRLVATKHRSPNGIWTDVATILSVDLIGNSVTMLVGAGAVESKVSIPLDLVEAACRADDTWNVFIRGVFEQMQWAPHAPAELRNTKYVFIPCG